MLFLARLQSEMFISEFENGSQNRCPIANCRSQVITAGRGRRSGRQSDRDEMKGAFCHKGPVINNGEGGGATKQ